MKAKRPSSKRGLRRLRTLRVPSNPGTISPCNHTAVCSRLTRLERGMLRFIQKFKGRHMATEIISYGFAPGPITKKDMEPEPIQVVQPIQQDFREAIIFILAIALALFAATQFMRTLRQFPLA